MYRLLYIEKNGRRAPRDRWSVRQTGIFHNVRLNQQDNCYILIHPMINSAVENRLDGLLTQPNAAQLFDQNPLMIHVLILSSYLENWQPYMETISQTYKSLVSSYQHHTR